MDVIVVTDETKPEMLRLLIANEVHRAKRCVPKCGRDDDHPTPWDLHHRRINGLLGDLIPEVA